MSVPQASLKVRNMELFLFTKYQLKNGLLNFMNKDKVSTPLDVHFLYKISLIFQKLSKLRHGNLTWASELCSCHIGFWKCLIKLKMVFN